MGAGASGTASSTIEKEVAIFASHLPMAELLNGGIIRLPGASGYFNPDSLLEPSWLKGKMTVEEYRSAINYINSCAVRKELEIKSQIWPKETYEREKAKAEAGQAAVQKLNEQQSSVRFTYQQSLEKVEYIPIYDKNLLSYISVLAEKGRYLTVRYYIYMNVN
ncbi:unnamed protein product [Rotaria sp. Silwood2]|nr:unnamed protein product [Rotaria sp. Silwood2]CAF2849195.1 unnamed protein product [Rotaria sp. Silwood2]CAF3475875.1 unnamed protein product [Rotaria sp. Silwood2]CAF4263765.1 unnamed protein product [Rotaria sp. Silwood2]CAF4481204.1 unnamed protein product [Rotaria sp. Silwood2]